ncbi:MAG: methyl-accepting chemotaxis protein [Venatoribacter sp.]
MFKKLLWPAIKLMSQLSYAAKFSLISVMFLIPIVVLGGQVFFAASESLNKTEEELHGLNTTKELIEFAHALEEFRDIAAVAPFQSANEQFNAKVEPLQKNIRKLIQDQIDHAANPNLKKLLVEWQEKSAHKLSFLGENRQPTYNDQFRYFQLVIDDVYLLIQQYNQSTGLSLDADSSIQQLVGTLPLLQNVTKMAGLGHGIGMYSLIEKYLQSTTYDQLNNVYDQMLTVDTDMQLLLNSAKNINNDDLLRAVKEAQQAMVDLRNELDEKVISAYMVTDEWSDFDASYQTKIAKILRIESLVFPLIEQKLSERLEYQRTRITVLASVLFIALSVITYLYVAFFMSIRYTIKRFTGTAEVIANGDLTKEIKFKGRDEMGHLRDSFNGMISHIRSTLSSVKDGTAHVSQNVNEVERIAQLSRHAVQEQLEQTQQISRIIMEMAERTGDVVQLAEEAEVAAQQGHTKSDEAGRVINGVMKQISNLSQEVSHSMEAVNRLADNSTSISSILATIKGIAEQTNLLALNAAIEAARAGEAGRGFAVVADEVRTLASRTQGSAQEIESLINEVQTNIVNAVQTMETNRTVVEKTVEQSSKVTATLQEIQNSMDDIQQKTGNIVQTSAEQKRNALSLEKNLESVRSSGQQTADNADNTVKAVRTTQEITDSLAARVGQFKV